MSSLKESRICVKNLPKYLGNDALLKHFEGVGQITEAFIVRDKEFVGYTRESRQFGFVGFNSIEAAETAVKKMNKTFIGTSKIICEPAFKSTDPSLARPWSKHSKGSSAFDRKKESAAKELEKKKKREKRKAQREAEREEKNAKGEKKEKKEKKGVSIDEMVKERGSKAEEFLGIFESRKKKGVASNDFVKADQDEIDFNESSDDDEYVDMDKAQKPEGSTSDDDKSEFVMEKTEEERKEEEENEAAKLAETLAETGRLIVKGIHVSSTEDDIKKAFQVYGEISDIQIPLRSEDHTSKGVAFVTFMFPGHALKAQSESSEMFISGKRVWVEAARAPPQNKDELKQKALDGELGFKAKKAAEMKEQRNDEKTWNALFIRSDAAVEAFAKQQGVSKAEILDNEVDNMAVRVALAETQAVSDVKKWLKENNVSEDVLRATVEGTFKFKTEHDRTCILVKNLPASANEGDLRALFAEKAEVSRFIMPASNTMAIVQFLTAADANLAFNALAFKKYKFHPLKLQYLPSSVFTASVKKEVGSTIIDHEETELTKEQEQALQEVQTPTVSLFVRNLDFTTTDARLTEVFSRVGEVVRALIGKKKNDKGKELSQGWAHVEYRSKNDAMNALKKLQGLEVDGRKIEIQLSERKSTVKEVKRKEEAHPENCSRTKLLIKNMPFQTNKKEIRQLFQPFGEIKSLRLPTKHDGSLRGFGFIELGTPSEAKNAMESLAATHLYGRHLVLRWAQEEESLAAKREKAGEQWEVAAHGKGKTGDGAVLEEGRDKSFQAAFGDRKREGASDSKQKPRKKKRN